MKKKKKSFLKKGLKFLNLHMYGIFDFEKQTIIKVSLDQSEIDMDIALMNGLGDNLTQCEFDITLLI